MSNPKRKIKGSCIICNRAAAEIRGMCTPCYSWDYYHVSNGHGAVYFRKYEEKLELAQTRAATRTKAVKRRGLRVVK